MTCAVHVLGKRMEMRKGAFPARCRVAVVDQWIDSGGSMRAAIELVERQQGVVRVAELVYSGSTSPSSLLVCAFPA